MDVESVVEHNSWISALAGLQHQKLVQISPKHRWTTRFARENVH